MIVAGARMRREILVFLAASTLALTGAEAYLRVFLPQELETPSYVRRFGRLSFEPGAVIRDKGRARLYDVVYRINAFGFRGPAFSPLKAPGVYRIAALGPSMTFGEGVEEDALYTAVLQRRLDAAAPGRFEVANYGWGGMSMALYETLYRRIIRPFRPDIVVVYIRTSQFDSALDTNSESDVGVAPASGLEALRLRLRKLPLYVWLCENSNLWALRRTEIAARLNAPAPAAPAPAPAAPAAAAPDTAALSKAADGRIDDLARSVCADRVRLLLMRDPMDFARYPDVERHAEDLQKSTCLSLVDISVDDNRFAFGPKEIHWTPTGHAYVAGRIEDALRARGLLRTGSK